MAVLLAFLAGLLLGLTHPDRQFIFLIAVTITALFCLFGQPRHSKPSVLLLLFAAIGAVTGADASERNPLDCRHSLLPRQALVGSGILEARYGGADPAGRTPLLPFQVMEGDCAGEFRLRLPPDLGAVPVGSSLQIFGHWQPRWDVGEQGLFPAPVLRAGTLVADSVTVDSAPAVPLRYRLRRSMDEALADALPQHEAMVDGLILGRREYIDSAVRERFAAAGLAHLLAISGMHVGLIASILLLLCGVIRLSPRNATLVSLAGMAVYLFAIGAPPSAIRAGIMLGLGLTARLLQRPFAAESAMAAAALLILAVDPFSILDIGFQLSFAGVIGLLVLRRPILDALPDSGKSAMGRFVSESIAASLAAFVATGPLVVHHFGVLAPISVVSGVTAVPTLAIALTGIIASAALGDLLPSLANAFAAGTAAFLDLLTWQAGFFAGLPWASFPVQPPLISFWVVLAIAAFVAQRLSARIRLPMRLAFGASVLFLLTSTTALAPIGSMELHFLDVGQGDAIAIRTPARRWILIDTGPSSESFDAGDRRIVPFLRQRGAASVSVLVLTHPDLDHIGGAPAVLRALPVSHLFEPGLAVGRSPYLQLLTVADSLGVEWSAARQGRRVEIDGIELLFLWPRPGSDLVGEDANEFSAAMRVRYGDFVLILTGDAGVEVEHQIALAYGDDLQADILKLGHHGSSTSTSQQFLDHVRPEIAIVSAGRNNRYGHPAPNVLDLVAANGIDIARTDTEGTISYRITDGGAVWHRLD